MANMSDVAKGLKLFIRGLDFQLTGVAGPPHASSRMAKYRLFHLEGTSCPHCKTIGTLVRLIPEQKEDVSDNSPIPIGIEGRDKILAETFDIVSGMQLDAPTGLELAEGATMTDVVLAQEERRRQVAKQSFGWICFECGEQVETVEFIGQLEKHN